MIFEFATANQIIFGPGKSAEAGPLAAKLGSRALLVTGADSARARHIIERLKQSGVSVVVFPVAGEPSTTVVQQGAVLAREGQAQLVIGFGGGSALDAAKAIAALARNEGSITDYLEVIGGGKPLTRPSLPCIAIPTTAGTGSEVTRNAVLTAPEHQVKVSLRSPWLLPQVALIDPELTYSLPPSVTANTGLDALTQLIEPFVCNRANPITDAFCREGIARAARSLRIVFETRNNAAAREAMSVASLLGGLALANSGLGAVHGFAAPIGGLIEAPHGGICAALLPHVMEINLRALRSRTPHSPALARYDELARLLTGDQSAVAAQGVEWVQKLTSDLRVSALGAYGLKPEHIGPLVEKGLKASSMKANPVVLTAEELREILIRAA